MNILHYHMDLREETGGVVRAVFDTCSALAATEHTVTLASPNPQDVPETWGKGDPNLPAVERLESFASAGNRFSSAQLKALIPLLKRHDVLHLHGMWIPSNMQLAKLAKKVGLPYVLSVHGMLDDWCMAQKTLKKRIFLAMTGRKVLEQAAAVHCTAGFELEQSRVWFPNGNGVIIPLILDLDLFKNPPGPDSARARFAMLDNGRPTLLFLSRLHYKKGVERLIDAAQQLVDRNIDADVIIAGTGDEKYVESLRQRVRKLNLEERVHFPGFVAGLEKVSLFEAADIFVLPTSQENFGFVFFEALAARTPVITTKGADTWPEMEESGGAIITSSDPTPLTDCIAELLADPDRRTTMGAAGRDWVFTNLSADAVVDRFLTLYEACSAR